MDKEAFKQRLILEEANKLKPYRCQAGKLTIGVGRNLDDNGITNEESMYLLNNDIESVEKDLDAFLPWWRDLDNNRQQALADMTFNMGIVTVSSFKNTMKAIEEGRWADAAAGIRNSLYYKQVTKRAERNAKLIEGT